VILADVPDPEVARLAVEREAPRIAQPVADDLPRRSRSCRVDAEELAEAALGVELELPAVVVVEKVPATAPLRTILIVPGCSTTYNVAGSPGALVT
jgi:hypothetical protein